LSVKRKIHDGVQSSGMDFEQRFYEAKTRIFWFIDNMDRHGLTWELYWKIPTQRLCEVLGIHISYFTLIR